MMIPRTHLHNVRVNQNAFRRKKDELPYDGMMKSICALGSYASW